MSFDPQDFDRSYRGQSGARQETLEQYTTKTFLWMFLGLMVTFSTCMVLFITKSYYFVWSVPNIHLVLLVAQLGVVIFLSARLQKLSVGMARALFLIYSALTGITFTSVLAVYGLVSVVYTFGLTAAYFGVLAAYGFFTRTDLSRMRTILFSGLIFLVVMGLLSMFFNMDALDRVLCLVGIAVFLGLTAYDTQKIRSYYYHFQGDAAMLERASIFSALQLYLDFVNLFLYLLRFLGSKKD